MNGEKFEASDPTANFAWTILSNYVTLSAKRAYSAWDEMSAGVRSPDRFNLDNHESAEKFRSKDSWNKNQTWQGSSFLIICSISNFILI